MLYQNQKSNPRSPLTVIRNQIKHNLQVSSSRSISRSPSYSPVSRNINNTSKDYSNYIPVRSFSKGENIKPSSATANHIELKNSRKFLVNETRKLEEKVKEIKRKVESEVKNIRNRNNRKIPRSHCSLIWQKLVRIVYSKLKDQSKLVFDKIQGKAKEYQTFESKAILMYSRTLKKKVFYRLISLLKPLTDVVKGKEAIARRHYSLQLLFTSIAKWQEIHKFAKS